jgi:hypothetical protein
MTMDLEFNRRPGEDGYIMSGGKKIWDTKSEDILTANVFGHLKYIKTINWIELLINDYSEIYPSNNFKLSFWKNIPPPKDIKASEGNTEVDVIIESSNTVIFIECKYHAEASEGTTGSNKIGEPRNQIIRTIDVGLNYSLGVDKKFFFTYLTTTKKDIPIEISHYKNVNTIVRDIKGYHKNDLVYLKNISSNQIKWVTWEQIGFYIFQQCENLNSTEKMIAKDLLKYLCLKGLYDYRVCKNYNSCVIRLKRDVPLKKWSKEIIFELMGKLNKNKNKKRIRLMEILVEGSGKEKQERIIKKLGPHESFASLRQTKRSINDYYRTDYGKILPNGKKSPEGKIHEIEPTACGWVVEWFEKRNGKT